MTAAEALVAARPAPRTTSLLLSDVRAWIALPILALVATAAIGAEALAPFDPNNQSLIDNLQPPTLQSSQLGVPPHFMGTDHLGRDILSRVVHGARVSLLIGLVTSLIAAGVGVVVGLLAGYRGGLLGSVLMRVADIQIAFPFLILAIAVIAAVGPSAGAVVLTLAAWGWVPFARLVRGEVLVQKGREYIAAQHAIGSSPMRVVVLHLLPNIAAGILVQLTFFVGIVIVSEGALSFLGLGVQPPDASWGRMMSEGRSRLASAWWMAVFPGIALSITVLAVNLLGDALTDALNPRTRSR